MRDLSKKLGLLPIMVVLVFGIGLPFVPARADNPCSQWSLLDASNKLVTGATPNQISAGDTGFDAQNPPVSLIVGTSWQCTRRTTTSGSVLTPQDQQAPQGTEACQKATVLAARFGGFTALDATFSSGIQKTVLDNVTNFLKNEVQKDTGISLDYNSIKSKLFSSGGQLIQSQFDSLIGNPLKGAVSSAAKGIMDAAKQEADKLAKEYLGKIASGITDILGIDASVPVNDQVTQQKLDVVNQSVNNVIAEQKHQELIADTRSKCNDLLNKVTSAIKRSLLYQLSGQISDWIQNGQTPQFVKQPGQFLEDTGNLALDRFISRVAPQLCQPFRLAIQVQIPTTNRQANPFYDQVTCSLKQVTDNVKNFYSDFRQGGWLTYQEVWKPQNNYYGAYIMTMDAAARTAAAATQAAQQDVSQGRGFLSQRRCTEWTKFVQTDASADEFLSGSEIVGTTAFVRDSVVAGQEDGSLPETGLSGDQTGRYWSGNNSYFFECTKNEITNPGTITASLSEKANSTDFDYLSNTTDIENFLQTIQDSIVNKLVKSGVNGLRNLLPSWLPPITH